MSGVNGLEDTDVLLAFGDTKVVMNIEDALRVATALNSAPKITSSWHSSGTLRYIGAPDTVASVLPITPIDRIKWMKDEEIAREGKR